MQRSRFFISCSDWLCAYRFEATDSRSAQLQFANMNSVTKVSDFWVRLKLPSFSKCYDSRANDPKDEYVPGSNYQSNLITPFDFDNEFVARSRANSDHSSRPYVNSDRSSRPQGNSDQSMRHFVSSDRSSRALANSNPSVRTLATDDPATQAHNVGKKRRYYYIPPGPQEYAAKDEVKRVISMGHHTRHSHTKVESSHTSLTHLLRVRKCRRRSLHTLCELSRVSYGRASADGAVEKSATCESQPTGLVSVQESRTR